MRINIKVFVGIAIAILITIGIVQGASSQVQAQSMPSMAPSTQPAPASSNRSPGLPAIPPRLLSTSATTPAFTEADVRAYLNTRPFPSGPLVKGATSTVVEIKFITSAQASALMQGESTGLPDTALVCYVKLHGPFEMTHASTPPGAKPLPPTTFGIEVFDAYTGNLLMWGTP